MKSWHIGLQCKQQHNTTGFVPWHSPIFSQHRVRLAWPWSQANFMLWDNSGLVPSRVVWHYQLRSGLWHIWEIAYVQPAVWKSVCVGVFSYTTITCPVAIQSWIMIMNLHFQFINYHIQINVHSLINNLTGTAVSLVPNHWFMYSRGHCSGCQGANDKNCELLNWFDQITFTVWLK